MVNILWTYGTKKMTIKIDKEWEEWKKEYEEGGYTEYDLTEDEEFDLDFDDEGYEYYNEQERDK